MATDYEHRYQAIPQVTANPKRTVVAFLLIWGLGDLLSTLFMTAVHGPMFEANPAMRLVLLRGGLDFLIVKGLGITIVAALMYYWRDSLWSNRCWVPIIEVLLIWGVLVVAANTLAGLGVGVA